MENETSFQLFDRFREGDEQAAALLFDRYVSRLTALARSRMSAHLERRVAAEDVVQSVYGSFFVRAREGQYALEQSGDLWRLLAAITLNKVYRQAERHTAGKRSINAERSFQADNDASFLAAPPEMLDRQPSPDEAAMVSENLQLLMEDFPDLQRQMLQLRLQGYLIEEIAEQVGRSERSVRRVLDKARDWLKARAASDAVE